MNDVINFYEDKINKKKKKFRSDNKTPQGVINYKDIQDWTKEKYPQSVLQHIGMHAIKKNNSE